MANLVCWGLTYLIDQNNRDRSSALTALEVHETPRPHQVSAFTVGFQMTNDIARVRMAVPPGLYWWEAWEVLESSQSADLPG